MTNLKLITIENFGELQCNFYRNMNDDILLTREQIGTALEYSNPSTAIKNLHRKHKDRLDSLSMKIKLGRLQNEPTSKSDEQERVYYTERGIMEICRWSRQPKANLFMDWVWDIVEKYRNKEIVDITLLSSTLNKMVAEHTNQILNSTVKRNNGNENIAINNHYDSLLTVNGNVDRDALPGLEKLLQKSYEYTSKRMYKDAGLMGIQKKL